MSSPKSEPKKNLTSLFFIYIFTHHIYPQALIKSKVTPHSLYLSIFSPHYMKVFLKFFRGSCGNLVDMFFFQHPSKKIFVNYVLYDFNSSEYYNTYLAYQNYISNSDVFCSLGWIEREFQEFMGVSIANIQDSRNLLLDYNKTYNPLLKIFPCTGFEEVYYDNLFDAVKYIPVNFVEL